MDVNLLPVPQSRSELFLDYIARNMNAGGNGGLTQDQVQTMINEFVKNAIFDESTKTLSFEKEDGTIIDIDLSSLDVSWKDLEYVSEYSRINLMNYSEKVTGYSYRGRSDAYQKDRDWSVFFLEVKPNKQYTVYRKTDDISRYIFTDSVGGRKLDGITVNTKYNSNGFIGTAFTIPNNASIKKVAIQFNHTQNSIKDIVVLEGDINSIDGFIPYTNGKSLQIGKDVSLEFDASGTNLLSQTIHNAIVEVNNKIPKKTDGKVFNVDNNVWNATYFRIPSLLRTKKGSLLATTDIRYNSSDDHSFIDIGCSRSVDNGNTWEYKIAMQNNRVDTNRSRVMDSTMLQTKDGKIILLCGSWDRNPNNWTTYNGMPDPDWNPYIVTSTDDGITWSEKVSLKDSSKCANQPQGAVAWLGGVGTGIQMKNGTLIFPIQICYFQNVSNGNGSNKTTKAGLIYSNDDGETWTMSQNFVNGTENMIVEVNDKLVMSARNGTNRASYITSDLGRTWEVYQPLHNKILNRAHGCQGSFIAFDTLTGHRVGLISTPKNLNNNYTRDNITIYMIDFDSNDIDVKELLVPYPYAGNASGAGYSSLAYGTTKDGQRKLDIIYEDDGSISHQDITFLLSEIEDIVSQNISSASWSGLNYVEVVKPFVNLYNHPNKYEAVGTFVSGGGVSNTSNRDWTRVVIPVVGGRTYYFSSVRSLTNSEASNILGSSDVVEFNTNNNTFDSTTHVQSNRFITASIQINGRNILSHTTHKDTTHLAFNINTGSNFTNAKDEFMVWDSSQHMPNNYVADKILESVTIDGSKVNMSFSSTTGLTSDTVREALDELNEKIRTSYLNHVESIVGELKIFAFDSGEQFEADGRTWLRCDGQSLSEQDYNKLYKHIRNVSKENLSTFRLPNKPDYGYLYICVG